MIIQEEKISLDGIDAPQIYFDALPIMPTRNLVMFPEVVFPITLVRESSRSLARRAEKTNTAIGVFCQRTPDIDSPAIDDLHPVGVAVQVLKVITMPDDNAVALVRGLKTTKITGQNQVPPPIECDLCAMAVEMAEPKPKHTDIVTRELTICNEKLKELGQLGSEPPFLASISAEGDQTPLKTRIGLMCINAPIPTEQRQSLLAAGSSTKRIKMLCSFLAEKTESQRMMAEIDLKAKEKINSRARGQFIEAKIEELKAELYGSPQDEIQKLRKRLSDISLPDDTTEFINQEIAKLDNFNPQSAEYQTQHSYLQTVLDLPWGVYTEDSNDFAAAEKSLNDTHSGMEKVKERVLEQLALVMHSPKTNAPILCLVGPPGVGKTSLGQTIARAMGRKFRRVSLGGLHDESEIRGHRRTYIGAMPGRIIDAVKRAGTMNPVIMLDEIDKVGADYKGDPAAALLEVLDPEQNNAFHDNYLDIDFDLSRVMFITTANTLSPIASPLLDRMEVVSLTGYTPQEKTDIARQHLIPTLMADMDIDGRQFAISDGAIAALIEQYTGESGVRQLQKRLSQLMRKAILARASKKKFPRRIEPHHLRELLGPAQVSRDKYGTDGLPGIVTGLAWTAAGGEVLYIETAIISGKEKGQLTLTGNLGDVMKESAAMAHRYVQSHGALLDISADRLESNFHIHVPEGAIPKDGPSAGITITMAIVSALTDRPVRDGVAMTGEMTLRGRVLPVGGIKEKMLAAKRAGIKEIILSELNRDNVEEIPGKYREGLTFHFVSTALEAIDIALK